MMSYTDRPTTAGYWATVFIHALALLTLPTVFALWVTDGSALTSYLGAPALVLIYGWALADALMLAGRWGR